MLLLRQEMIQSDLEAQVAWVGESRHCSHGSESDGLHSTHVEKRYIAAYTLHTASLYEQCC